MRSLSCSNRLEIGFWIGELGGFGLQLETSESLRQLKFVPSAKGLGQSKEQSLARHLDSNPSQNYMAKSAKPRVTK
jgi:hypothetical protein